MADRGSQQSDRPEAGAILRAMRKAGGLNPDRAAGDPGFGVYVHWPFCAAKCPYCDFNSHVRHGGVDAMGFADAICRELETMRGRTGPRDVASIFFGGGTPSLMPVEAVGQILDRIGALWTCEPDVEVTLEANPTSVEAERFRGYRAAGVNRVSLGVQSLRDTDLKALGRLHDSAEARKAIALAQSCFRACRLTSSMRAWGNRWRLARRAGRGSVARGRTSVALSADHRAGNALCSAA
jgi:coproporphyrinogen III oxidase-like Fe-S oxidoreductase